MNVQSYVIVYIYTSIHVYNDTNCIQYSVCVKSQKTSDNLCKYTKKSQGTRVPYKIVESYTFSCIFIHKIRETLEITAL